MKTANFATNPHRAELNRRRSVWLRTLILSLIIVAALGIGSILLCRQQFDAQLADSRRDSAEVLTLHATTIRLTLIGIGEAILLLARQNELLDYLQTGDPEDWQNAANEYLHIVQTFGDFDQVRFLDTSGMEIIRVDYHAGSPEIVPIDQLQDKSARYYFQETIHLEPYDVYVSALDLNIEQNEIEIPYKPMLRFGTCVYDREEQKRGIVVINYLAENLLELLEETRKVEQAQILLVNPQGYWLKGPTEADEWGFMFESRIDRTISNAFPDAAERIESADSGQLLVGSGLFTFRTIYPAATMQNAVPTEDARYWKLTSHLGADEISAMLLPIRSTWWSIFGGTSLIGIVLSFVYSRLRVQQIDARRQIEVLATYDSLTGAYNRHFFEQRVEEEVARATRHHHSIAFLMVDVTRFKQVNDTYGHAEGDRVLVEIASILQASVRLTDLVVRYGGDEFLVMFPETPTEAESARLRIRDAVDEVNRTSKFAFPIVLALGAAVWDPDSNQSIDEVLHLSDQRMYEHKQTQYRSGSSSPAEA